MTGNAALYQKFLNFAASIVLVLMLAACDSKTTHTFVGHMDIISLPQPYLVPETIVLGAHGNMWFLAIAYSHFGTSSPSGAIGRVMSSGKITLFLLRFSLSAEQSLCAKPVVISIPALFS